MTDPLQTFRQIIDDEIRMHAPYGVTQVNAALAALDTNHDHKISFAETINTAPLGRYCIGYDGDPNNRMCLHPDDATAADMHQVEILWDIYDQSIRGFDAYAVQTPMGAERLALNVAAAAMQGHDLRQANNALAQRGVTYRFDDHFLTDALTAAEARHDQLPPTSRTPRTR